MFKSTCAMSFKWNRKFVSIVLYMIRWTFPLFYILVHGICFATYCIYSHFQAFVCTGVSDCCLSPTQQFYSYIMARTVNFQWNSDEVRFVLYLQALLDFYSAISLKQQSMDRHAASLEDIILIPSQPVFALSP